MHTDNSSFVQQQNRAAVAEPTQGWASVLMLSWVLPEVKPERSRMSVSRVAEAATEGDSVKCIFESQFVSPLLRFGIGQIASMMQMLICIPSATLSE